MKTDGAGWDITRQNLHMKKTTTLAILLILMTIVGCKKEYYTISVQSNTPGCLVSGGGSYESGSYISISAIPADGYKFKEWNDGNTNNPRYITVSHDATYIATFEKTNGGGGNSSSISAPTGVTASIYEDEEGVFVYVKWNSVSNAVKYNIYYSTSNGSYSNIGSVTSNYCYITNPNTNNYVKVTAVSSNGTESNMSNYAYCSYNGGGGGGTTVPNAPTGVTATNVGSSSNPQIEIAWNSVSNATSYKVYRSSSASGTYSQIGSATSNTYSYDNNPLSGHNYYKVRAVNSAGESSYSSYAHYNNTGGGSSYSPCPPTVTVSGTSSQTVSWTVPTTSGCGTPTSFEVRKYEPCSGTWELKTTTTSHSYTCPSSSVHPGINRYTVTAINSNGSDGGTGVSSSVSLAKPSSFSVQKLSGGNIKFTWSVVTKATGYQIYVLTPEMSDYALHSQVNDGNTSTLTEYYPAPSGTRFKIRAFYDCGYVGGPIYSNFTSYQVIY